MGFAALITFPRIKYSYLPRHIHFPPMYTSFFFFTPKWNGDKETERAGRVPSCRGSEGSLSDADSLLCKRASPSAKDKDTLFKANARSGAVLLATPHDHEGLLEGWVQSQQASVLEEGASRQLRWSSHLCGAQMRLWRPPYDKYRIYETSICPIDGDYTGSGILPHNSFSSFFDQRPSL